jgi:hypothetical protein
MEQPAAPTKSRRKPTTRRTKPPAPPAAPDPVETPLARRDLEDLIERFVETLTHPVQRAIAPQAIHALVAFAAIERKPTATITFGWIDPEKVIALTPVDDEHPADLAACYFGVLAWFYRFRAYEGALDRRAADRITGMYSQAGMSFAQLDAARTGPKS